MHAATDLADGTLWPALQRLKAEGVFARIGISVYAAERPAELAARFNPGYRRRRQELSGP